mgnify:CR=1 FL=1
MTDLLAKEAGPMSPKPPMGEPKAKNVIMLFMEGGGRITRVHGPFVSDEEVESVVNFLKKQGDPEYDDEVVVERDETNVNTIEYKPNGSDDLYDQAVSLVARERKASTSFIQRHLKIGYNRAATIIEKMEENNVISKPGRAGKREIMSGNQ